MCWKRTFLRKVLQDRLSRLLHVGVTGHVQFEHLQVAGAVLGEGLGTVAIWKQTASKDHKSFLVQTSGQLVSEAAVAAGNEHAVTAAVRHAAALLTGRQFGDHEDQQSHDRQAANGLADEEGAAHAAAVLLAPAISLLAARPPPPFKAVILPIGSAFHRNAHKISCAMRLFGCFGLLVNKKT